MSCVVVIVNEKPLRNSAFTAKMLKVLDYFSRRFEHLLCDKNETVTCNHFQLLIFRGSFVLFPFSHQTLIQLVTQTSCSL